MPQSEMYRKGGIFARSLRYAPLTLTTLAALVPEELEAEIVLIDQGVEPLDVETLEADLVGLTCITANAALVYDLSARLRARGVTTVIGGVHPTLVPDEAQPHADAIVVGYAEESWPRLLRDFVAGRLQQRYDEAPDYRFENVPEPRRDLLKRRGYITLNTVQAVRGCPWRCSFCVVPVAWPGYLHRPVPEVIREIERLDGDTFLAEKPFGEGRVISCAVPCDADWSNLPLRPFYLPLMQRLCVYLASTVFPSRNLDVGKPIVALLQSRQRCIGIHDRIGNHRLVRIDAVDQVHHVPR